MGVLEEKSPAIAFVDCTAVLFLLLGMVLIQGLARYGGSGAGAKNEQNGGTNVCKSKTVFS